jgi:hypothetical protein
MLSSSGDGMDDQEEEEVFSVEEILDCEVGKNGKVIHGFLLYFFSRLAWIAMDYSLNQRTTPRFLFHVVVVFAGSAVLEWQVFVCTELCMDHTMRGSARLD